MDCSKEYITSKGDIKCRLADRQVEALEKKIRDLEARLSIARDKFSELVPRAKREEKLHLAMIDLFDQLKHINITKGAWVPDLRKRIDKVRETIVDAMK